MPRLADFWLPIVAQARLCFAGAKHIDGVSGGDAGVAMPVDTPAVTPAVIGTPASMPGMPPDAAREPAGQIGVRLAAALDQAAARSHEHGFDAQAVEHAMFAVVAWIDEAAMVSDWPGARAWRLAPLQRRYFSTTRAGTQFFERLDALDDEETAAREVYALMLVAGFVGHYGGERLGELSVYRRRLLERVQAEGGMRPVGPTHPLFPDAEPAQYAAQRYSRRMRPLMAWLLVLGGPVAVLAILYLAFDLSLTMKVGALFGGGGS